MTQNEYFKISITRGGIRKKGCLYILSSFFDVAFIHHNEIEKVYTIPAEKVASLTERELNLFEKLLRKFSVYDEVSNGKLIIKYNYL